MWRVFKKLSWATNYLINGKRDKITMTTRSQKKSVKPSLTTGTPKKRVENSWILLLKESVLDNTNFNIITLPHPATGNPTKYCLDDAHKKMYEVITFNEPYRSWFVGETVKSDGSLLMVTPVNPLFLVLPRLREQCYNRAVPLQDLLSEKGFDKIIDFIPDLSSIADLKGPIDIKAYKYNEDKILTWLQDRIMKLSNVLKEKNIHVTAGATSATFVSSSLNEIVDEEFYVKYAFGLVSEYLKDDLIGKLEKIYNFTPDLIETVGKKRKSELEMNGVNKKIKQEQNEDIPEEIKYVSTEVKKQKVLTVKEKARQKAATGTKTISSFFTKK